MAVCAAYGIAHSAFKSWDQLDQDKALAWHRRQQETHSCGVHPDVWDEERGGDPEGLRLKTRFCEACAIAEQAGAEFEKNRLPGAYQAWQFGPEESASGRPMDGASG